MLKTLFIGTNNEFDQNLIHWLSKRTDVKGVVWPLSTNWRKNLSGKVNFIKKRIKRNNIIKTMDEMIFYFVYHKFFASNDYQLLKKEIILPYRDDHFHAYEGPHMFSENLNDENTLNFIRTCDADLIFAMCVNDYFGKKLLNIPKYGVFLWHEGITPEYRGLYSPFWAIHNLDFDNVGYTLLKMNQKIDAGKIYVQGKLENFDPLKHHHGYLGHKAIWQSLDAVAEFLEDLDKGNAKPIMKKDAIDKYYSYPGITDFIRQKYRLSKLVEN